MILVIDYLLKDRTMLPRASNRCVQPIWQKLSLENILLGPTPATLNTIHIFICVSPKFGYFGIACTGSVYIVTQDLTTKF